MKIDINNRPKYLYSKNLHKTYETRGS